MNKRDVIKQAYGEYWKTYKDIIDDNGWFSNRLTGKDIPNNMLDFKTEKDDKQRPFRFRIKGLKGIENNNGWIKIESESDLPKEPGMYWVIRTHGDDISEAYFDNGFTNYYGYRVTHYQPITKPLKPIY